MRISLIAVSLLALAGAPSVARAQGAKAGKAKAEKAEPAVALIWKGAKNQEEAQRLGSAWEGIESLFTGGGTTFPEGFPKLVESRTVPGLKPGFWVWIVGFCPEADGYTVLDELKLVAPDTYARDVKVPKAKLACPDVGTSTLKTQEDTFPREDGTVLRVFTHEESSEPEGDEPGDSYSRTRYVFALMNKAGEVLDTASALGEETFSGDPRNGPSGYRCHVQELRAGDDGTVVFSRRCEATIAECGSMVGADEITTFTVSGDSVSSQESRANEEHLECGED